MKAITKRLRVLRTERDITQRDLAVRAKLGLQRYWDIENGYRTATDAEQAKIAKALKVQREDIWPSSAPSLEPVGAEARS